MRFLVAKLLIACCLALAPATALGNGLGEMLAYKYDRSAAALREGRTDYYLTGIAWHAPWAYDADKRDELNWASVGGGVGRSAVDANGNTHSLYGMVFRDSHYKAQYNVGYAWMTYWPLGQGVDGGLGYTVLVFARSDIGNYAPSLAAAPLASLRRGNFELMGTAIPGIAKDSGNIVFLFARFSLQ